MNAFQADSSFKPGSTRGPVLALKFLLAAVVSTGLMIYDHRSGDGNRVRDALSILLIPIHLIAELPRQARDLGVHFTARETLIEENERLRHEQLRLNARLQKLVALEAENRRIRNLLGSSRQLHEAVMIAEIQSASLDPYRQMIRINKGSDDGITAGQALIDAHGVVGQVLQVTPHSATAALITDDNQGVPVAINRNGLRTVAHGGGEATGIVLPHLPSNADVQVGDLLVSSGLGGRYPAGYPVGYVVEVRHHPGDHFMEVRATPAARLTQGRELLLVRPGEPVTDTALVAPPVDGPGPLAEAD